MSHPKKGVHVICDTLLIKVCECVFICTLHRVHHQHKDKITQTHQNNTTINQFYKQCFPYWRELKTTCHDVQTHTTLCTSPTQTQYYTNTPKQYNNQPIIINKVFPTELKTTCHDVFNGGWVNIWWNVMMKDDDDLTWLWNALYMKRSSKCYGTGDTVLMHSFQSHEAPLKRVSWKPLWNTCSTFHTFECKSLQVARVFKWLFLRYIQVT
jgi:hypothetical protein